MILTLRVLPTVSSSFCSGAFLLFSISPSIIRSSGRSIIEWVNNTLKPGCCEPSYSVLISTGVAHPSPAPLHPHAAGNGGEDVRV